MTSRSLTIADSSGRRQRQNQQNDALSRQATALEDLAKALTSLAESAAGALALLQLLAEPPVLRIPDTEVDS